MDVFWWDLCICDLCSSIRVVRVYLVGYIFYIINGHICQDIFGSIDIMYCKLPYVSRCVLSLKTLILYRILSLKTLILYIYRSRGTMQYNQQLYTIYSSYMIIRAYFFRFRFWSSKSFATFNHAAPGEINLDSTRGSAPGSLRIILVRRLLSPSCRHALIDWKFLLVGGEDSPSSAHNTSM
jgi:hypothetical protein